MKGYSYMLLHLCNYRSRHSGVLFLDGITVDIEFSWSVDVLGIPVFEER